MDISYLTVRNFAPSLQEIRNTKSETNSNFQIPRLQTLLVLLDLKRSPDSSVWNLGNSVIGICFGFRDSDFGFEILVFSTQIAPGEKKGMPYQ